MWCRLHFFRPQYLSSSDAIVLIGRLPHRRRGVRLLVVLKWIGCVDVVRWQVKKYWTYIVNACYFRKAADVQVWRPAYCPSYISTYRTGANLFVYLAPGPVVN